MQGELAEAVEAAQEVAAYEPEEDETVASAVIKKALKELIDDLRGNTGESALMELNMLQAQEKAITALEKRLKDSKTELKTLSDELDHKLHLKRFGADDLKAESQQLLCEVENQLAVFDEDNKKEKKKIGGLQKDRAALQSRMARIDAFLASIGGQLTEQNAKVLILMKLFDLADEVLNRYLNAEK